MAQVNFRVDDRVKHDADELFDNLGLNLSTAINIFLKQAIARRGFPFAISEKSAVTGMTAEGESWPFAQVVRREASSYDRERRRAELASLAGSWKDDRSTEEIIRDIEGHRTHGRKVEL